MVEATGPLPGEDELARRDPPCRFCGFGTLRRTNVGQEVSP